MPVSWRSALPPVRGRLLADEALAPFTWFRVGGPAQVLFLPADEDDLAALLAAVAPEVPVTVLGVGSNVIIRDGGVEGVAIRLAGRAFAGLAADPAAGTIEAGAGALDAALARAAANAGIAGLEFYAGIPGTIGGALTMNAGCYGCETSQVLVEARGLDRQGRRVTFTTAGARLRLSHQPRPGRDRVDLGDVPRPPRWPRRRARPHGRDHAAPRDHPADPRKDRWLDLQEPPRPLGMEAG